MATESVPPVFTYAPLPNSSSIRLLERLDPTPDGTLCFSLVTQDLEDPSSNPYACLSYTWGNPFAHGPDFKEHFDSVASQYGESSKVRVIVNGKSMLIQRNLHDAMSLIPTDAYSEFTNRLDDNRHHALHCAADQGQIECVKADDKTPSDVVREKSHDEVVTSVDGAADKLGDPEQARQIPRPLIWADAICINQDDVTEKSGQVAIMDRIYSGAMYVLAWLGPPDDRSDTGIDVLKILSTHLETFKQSTIEPFSGKDKDKYAEAEIPYISTQDWASLASIYQRQWFRRAWIVQEAVLPDVVVVYIGGKALTWDDLGQVAEAIRHNEKKLGSSISSQFIPIDEPAVSIVWNMTEVSILRNFKNAASKRDDKAKEYESQFTMKNLVYNFWTFGSSDPRDKIFAFYGLMNLFAEERQKTDYGSSLAIVYTMATRGLIRSEGSLRALSACVFPLHRRKDLPSWVPDYSLLGMNAIPQNFCVDKGLEYVPPKVPDDPTSNVLHLSGYFIGHVSAVGGRSGTKPSEKLLFDPAWLKLPLSLREKGGYLPGSSLSSLLWTTMCMDMSPGSMTDWSIREDKASSSQGIGFRIFILLAILAAGDAKVREKLGLEMTTESDLVFSHLDYDPMKEDLEPILADLDAFEELEGDQCWLPSRDEVLKYWNNFTYGLLRNTVVATDNGPIDYHLPAGVTQENSRPVGSGYVNQSSRVARHASSFMTAYKGLYGGRHLITINERYLGMASLATKPQDEVWVIPGLNAFAILRPTDDDPAACDCVKRYVFMGSAYISGMMHGEVVPLLNSKIENIELI